LKSEQFEWVLKLDFTVWSCYRHKAGKTVIRASYKDGDVFLRTDSLSEYDNGSGVSKNIYEGVTEIIGF
jgi:hypothetical protein